MDEGDIVSAPRFQLIADTPEFPNDGETCWYWDTARPAHDGQPFIAVQVYCGRDPNAFRRVEGLRLLFTDQAEYSAVCPDCYLIHAQQQWSGSTRGGAGWRARAERWLAEHQRVKGWCCFCDPIFGNGGWRA